jgi:hypothetical protein
VAGFDVVVVVDFRIEAGVEEVWFAVEEVEQGFDTALGLGTPRFAGTGVVMVVLELLGHGSVDVEGLQRFASSGKGHNDAQEGAATYTNKVVVPNGATEAVTVIFRMTVAGAMCSRDEQKPIAA